MDERAKKKRENILMSKFRTANCYALNEEAGRNCKGIGKFRLVLIDDR